MRNEYGIYRKKTDNRWNKYTIWFIAEKTMPEYFATNLITVEDNKIHDNQFNEFAPWVPNTLRFVKATYDDIQIPQDRFDLALDNLGREFLLERFTTIEEARQWIRDNTNLVERTAWVFVISEEYVDETIQETIPEVLLVID